MTTLHATYLPDRHAFALWEPDVEPAANQPSIRIPQPVGYGTQIRLAPAEVGARIVAVNELPDTGAASVTAWRRLIDDPTCDIPLPGAAHALLNEVGDAVITADYARATFAATHDVAARLAPVVAADLRDYQCRGVSWLAEVAATGGGILADEMGLGKTLQTIAHLVLRDTGPVLVVCPTGLVTNWIREIRRWAPNALSATDYRGGGLPDSDAVVVTGYPTLRRHPEALTSRNWDTVVFDEAQALKNSRTQVSKAARALKATSRIALTGTPVENHLDELWAILSLVAPTEFGNRALFRRRYTLPIQSGSTDAVPRLRDAISGRVLRRTKSEVATSLGPKITMDIECDLTDEQGHLYDQVLTRADTEGFGTGIARRGAVLAALTRLIQICNHPALLDGATATGDLSGRSGKLDVCAEVVGANIENGSPTVVFTQYRATGELLARHLAAVLDAPVPFLHGGLPRTERDRLVDDYQAGHGCGVLIASLKAAGTGLTLTRAADVVHFDRWWNPAVEAQATDRVHRIGQDRVVTVTTLTTAGTLEEHIAAMHRRKSALDLDADSNALAALTELSDEKLLDVLRRNREEMA